ncbi:MAG: ABC transporter permease [Candidatus Schekmanbacteria bacterium]|nr:ABC transporter permease [Candidatus Schekmanbacteria bacterium]
MKQLAQTIFHHRRVLLDLAIVDIRRRYLSSVLGLGWAFLRPLATFALYAVVFGAILRMKVPSDVYGSDSYGLFLIVALVPWFAIFEFIARGSAVLFEQRDLVMRMAFPAEALPIPYLLAALFNHAIWIGLLLLFLRFSGMGWSAALIWAPVLVLLLAAMGLGILWFLAGVNVFLRDLGHFAEIGLNFAFFATPIVYSLTSVPPAWRFLLMLNPFYYPIEAYRSVFLAQCSPPIHVLVGFSVVSLLFLFAGFRAFTALKPQIPDYL